MKQGNVNAWEYFLIFRRLDTIFKKRSGILATKSSFFSLSPADLSHLRFETLAWDLYLMWTKKSFVASTEKEGTTVPLFSHLKVTHDAMSS